MIIPTDSSRPELEFKNVKVGVLTVLTEEYAACLSIFDPDRNGVEKQKQATSGTLTCWLCHIPGRHGGQHVVAITRIPQMGNTGAAIAANILFQHCSAIKSLIMCGIAGAVPHPTKAENHVRLGDIVVSGPGGIIQYDFGKQQDPQKSKNDPFNGFEFRGPPRAPCNELLAATSRMKADELMLGRKELRAWEKNIDAFLKKIGEPAVWKRPELSTDKLIDTPDGTGDATPHPQDALRRRVRPRIFFGAIGAANIVLADPKKRDLLRDRFGLRAVEMEGSGVADASWVASIGYLVVRGTCDYCNSTKNDKWHHYAALIAAAYVRTLIEYLHVEEVNRPVAFSTLVAASSSSAESQAVDLMAYMPSQDSAAPTGPAVEQRYATGSTRQLAYEQVIIEPTSSAAFAPPPELNFAAVVDSGPPHDTADHRRIQELNDRSKEFLKNGRWNEATQLIEDLENLLLRVGRRGSVVQEGWITLANLEVLSLQRQRIAEQKLDTSRLQYLRKEAESVIV